MAEGIEYAGVYRAGGTFTCIKRFPADTDGTLGEPCGTEIVMHGYFWCSQICPKCLTSYVTGYGADDRLRDTRGWFDEPTKARIRVNIERNNGQYVPEFRHVR